MLVINHGWRERERERWIRSFYFPVIHLPNTIFDHSAENCGCPEKHFVDGQICPTTLCIRKIMLTLFTFYLNIIFCVLSVVHCSLIVFQDEKQEATSRSLRPAALSSSLKGHSTILSSSLRSDTLCEYLYTLKVLTA